MYLNKKQQELLGEISERAEERGFSVVLSEDGTKITTLKSDGHPLWSEDICDAFGSVENTPTTP